MSPFCKLSELPKVEGQPDGCAWGYFATDKSKRDELGSEWECVREEERHRSCSID